MKNLLPLLPLTALLATCAPSPPSASTPLTYADHPTPTGAAKIATLSTAPNPRADFLTLIDRPRVPADAQIPAAPNARDGAFHFSYASEKDQRVPALLMLPKATGKRPVVIALHGTGGSKTDELPLMRQLTAKGFIAVAIDGRYHGERAARTPAGALNTYETHILQAWQNAGQNQPPTEHPLYYDTVWDVMRLIDYLVTRDDVDPARIGLYGVSKGGIETYFTAAVDPRVAAAVPCISVESFQWALDNNQWSPRVGTFQNAWDAIVKQAAIPKPDSPFVADFYKRVVPGINGEFDGPALVPLIAPRPLMTINGDSDPRTPLAGLKLCTDAATTAYKAANAEDHLLIRIQPHTGHAVNPDSQLAAVDWFTQWLKP